MRLVAPITFAGRTALSVEISTSRSVPSRTGCLDNISRPDDVVGDGIFNIAFHQRDMFVRRSMENHLRTEIGENTLNPGLITDIRDDQLERQGGKVLPQFKHGFEDAVLAVTEQDKHLRTPAGDLAADFTTDGTACTGDQHPLPGQRRTDQFILDLRRFAPQKVGDIHFAQTVDTDLAADQFVQPRHGAERNALQAADICHQADDLPACAGDGNDDLIHRAVIQSAAQVGEFTDHRYPVDLMLLLGLVIIQVTDRVQAELWIFLHFPHHQRTGISRADDQDISGFPWHGLFTGRAPFASSRMEKRKPPMPTRESNQSIGRTARGKFSIRVSSVKYQHDGRENCRGNASLQC